jgi:hypothetical protein
MAEERTQPPEVPQADVQAEREIAERAGQKHQPEGPNKEEAEKKDKPR